MKLSNLEFNKPDLPKLVAASKKDSAKGLSSVKNSLQQLFGKEKAKTREVTLSPLERVKKTFSTFFHKHAPSKAADKSRTAENKTEVFSMQPSRKYVESVSQTRSREARFTPEYLIREAPKETFSPLKEEKRRALLANLNLELKGTLCSRNDGLLYLRVSEKLFEELSDIFPHEKCTTPDFDFRLGPSIPVVFPHENPLGQFFELGREFSFTLKRALLINQYDWPGVEKTLVLTLQSKELVQLRQSHGLTDKPDGRDFHLTLGVIRTTEPFAEKGFMRVHVGFHPV